MRRMALLHRAELRPTKLELLAAWLPECPWYEERASGDLVRVAAYRFDDPAGSVGIETMLVRFGDGQIYQVPLTYRGTPLDGADDWLIGTIHHSVLGRRWVYDGCGDPVYATALASAVVAGTGQAEELIEADGRLEARALTMDIVSDGSPDADAPVINRIARVVPEDPTLIVTDLVDLAVVRRVGAGQDQPGTTLSGTWSGQQAPVSLAYALPIRDRSTDLLN
jgi:hypothetical protein